MPIPHFFIDEKEDRGISFPTCHRGKHIPGPPSFTSPVCIPPTGILGDIQVYEIRIFTKTFFKK